MPEHIRAFSLDPQTHSAGESADGAHNTAAASLPAQSPQTDAPQGALELCPTQPEIAFTIVEHMDLGDISGTFSGRNNPSGNGVDLRRDSHVAFNDDELSFEIIPGHIDLADSAGQASRIGGGAFNFAGDESLKISGWYDSLNTEGLFFNFNAQTLEGAQPGDAGAPRFNEHGVSVLDHLVDSEAASLDNLLHDVPADLTKDGGATDAIHALTGGHGGYDTTADELYLQTLLDLLA